MADPTLTLWYDFAGLKTLEAVHGFGPPLGIVRPDPGTYYDTDGILRTAAAGVPRFGFDPATRRSLGLLFEPTRTNICLQSEDFSTIWTGSAGVFSSSSPAPDGTLTANLLLDDSGAIAESRLQTITVPDDSVTYALSAFIKKTDTAILGINSRILGGTQVTSDIRFQASTNTFSADSVAGVKSEDVGDYFRISWPITNNGTGNVTLEITIFPALRATINGAADVTATGSQTLWGFDVEVGAKVSSYIKTTTVAVTRNKDDVNAVIPTADWYNPFAGTFYVHANRSAPGDGGNSVLLEVSSDAGNRLHINSTFDGNTALQIRSLAVDQVLLTSADPSPDEGVDFRAVAIMTANDAELFEDGDRTEFGDQTLVMPNAPTSFNVGSNRLEGEQFHGHIAEIRYYNVRKDQVFGLNLSNGIIIEEPHVAADSLARPLAHDLAKHF